MKERFKRSEKMKLYVATGLALLATGVCALLNKQTLPPTIDQVIKGTSSSPLLPPVNIGEVQIPGVSFPPTTLMYCGEAIPSRYLDYPNLPGVPPEPTAVVNTVTVNCPSPKGCGWPSDAPIINLHDSKPPAPMSNICIYDYGSGVAVTDEYDSTNVYYNGPKK